jgi:Skp family chaperone for outer membrane proteins
MMTLVCLIGATVLCLAYGFTTDQTEDHKSISKAGVVSIRKIFQQCRRNGKYTERMIAERQKIEAQLQKLASQIEADKAGLKTLKPGSSDYMALMKDVMTKQAKLQADREFHNQQMELKDKQFTERLYQDILEEVRLIAVEKKLDLVFEKDEVEFPTSNANELMLRIRTHKLLYSGGCLDITDEVMAGLDAKESEEIKVENTEP